MAVSNQKFTYPLGVATGNLSAKRYHFVKWTALETLGQSTDGTSSANAGVLENNPTSGQAVAVTVFGETKITATTGVTVNALITTNASGRATLAVSGDWCMGRALEASAAEGDVITCLINPFRCGGAI